jgi:hypothetical protein
LYRINTHVATLDTEDYGTVEATFDLMWREEDCFWYLEELVVTEWEPDTMPKKSLEIMLKDYVDICGYGPTTPYEGEPDDEADDNAD